ncbi:hypothetical protein Q3G72_022789 [Acer saccharum]|nr:hypothetical protein Q3G72_022789 [Acer saccharum]
MGPAIDHEGDDTGLDRDMVSNEKFLKGMEPNEKKPSLMDNGTGYATISTGPRQGSEKIRLIEWIVDVLGINFELRGREVKVSGEGCRVRVKMMMTGTRNVYWMIY